MKAVVLNGAQKNDPTGQRVSNALILALESRGWEIEHVQLCDMKIGNCAGDFFCWIRSPGICNVNDSNRLIAKAIADSQLMVYLTPIRFGGYSSALKKMVDHQIQNVLPYFEKINGETHHRRRYPAYPDFLAIGWMGQPDAQSEAIFRHLAYRNAINLHAKKMVAGVVLANQPERETRSSVGQWLEELWDEKRVQGVPRLPSPNRYAGAASIQRALLLIGSPRTRKSTSNSLGSYLFEQLKARNIQTGTIYIHTTISSAERTKAMLEAVDAADLVLLAFPLYVDSLPAPVIQALERIASHREAQGKLRPQWFCAIVNCGFPEPNQNATALAICENFARLSEFQWAGSLALGAGEGMVHGAPLNELDGRVTPLKKALDLAAGSLAQGMAIPSEAQALLAKPFIPGWLYRTMGVYGWRQQAKQYGAEKLIGRRPYEITASG
ncbi:MAG TPA: NAD(P)H-dependent oxidoreductase [Anaerolineales bacterium]|nr:NAD(P)H-dependent oxidoreductase [Anaerolineales bacterium]